MEFSVFGYRITIEKKKKFKPVPAPVKVAKNIDIDEVIRMKNAGHTHDEIARHFNVSAKTIQRRLREFNKMKNTGQ